MRCRLNRLTSIRKFVSRSKAYRLLSAFVLLIILITGSGFICIDGEEPDATRGDLAVALNNVLIKAGVAGTLKPTESFVDMSDIELSRLRFTLSSGIMSGFPDGSFKPELPLRNLETRNYLRKLAQLLSPEQHSALRLQLSRIFALQDLSRSLLTGFHGSMVPSELIDPNGKTPRSFVKRLPEVLGLSGKIRLEGRVVDAVSLLPVASAHMVLADKLVTTDDQGKFDFEIASEQVETNDLFVAAEGYRPLTLKRDWRINPEVELRLNPVRSDLVVMAISDKSAVENFEVIINDGEPVGGTSGRVDITRLRPGFHRIRVRAKGYQEYQGNLRTEDGKREMIVTLARAKE